MKAACGSVVVASTAAAIPVPVDEHLQQEHRSIPYVLMQSTHTITSDNRGTTLPGKNIAATTWQVTCFLMLAFVPKPVAAAATALQEH
jgi:hypothetical protein